MLYEKGILKNFADITEQQLRQSLLFDKTEGPASLLIILNFINSAEFYRTPLGDYLIRTQSNH